MKIPKIKYGVPRIPQNCLTVKDGLSGSNPSMPFLLGVLRFTQPYFNQLLEVVKKNRNKISIDPSDRKTQELLENQFAKRMSILEPLKARIKFFIKFLGEFKQRPTFGTLPTRSG